MHKSKQKIADNRFDLDASKKIAVKTEAKLFIIDTWNTQVLLTHLLPSSDTL